MLVLITGGLGAGQESFARSRFPHLAAVPDIPERVRALMEEGKDPLRQTEQFLVSGKAANAVVLTREVGDGVVPADPFERKLRETTGRVNALLAEASDQVFLMTCGVPLQLKGIPGPLRGAQGEQGGTWSLVFLRHAATKGNREHRYVGTTQEDILAEERAFLQELSGRAVPFLPAGFDPDHADLFVSPMLRCRETAGLLFPGMRQQVVPDFRETDFGEFEYRNYSELKDQPGYQAFLDSGGEAPFPGGESRMQAAARVTGAFMDLLHT